VRQVERMQSAVVELNLRALVVRLHYTRLVSTTSARFMYTFSEGACTTSHPRPSYNADIPVDLGDALFNPTCSFHAIAANHTVTASTSARPPTRKVAIAYSYTSSIRALRDHGS
jgi:hypothetical protein